MKNESIKIVSTLMASEQIPDWAKDELQRIMRIETSAVKIKGFSMYDYIAKKDSYRHAFEGVYYDEQGYEVATEGHILVWNKTEIPDDCKGKIIRADGTFAEVNYPNWRAVIPCERKWDYFAIDFAKVEEYASDWKAFKKTKKDSIPVIKIDNVYINLELFVKYIKAMKFAGANAVRYVSTATSMPICFGSLESMGGIIMPLLPTGSYEKDWKVYIL